MKEIWLPVVGYEGLYEVSDLGRVRSLDKVWASRYSANKFPGRVLKPSVLRNGYLKVFLYRNSVSKTLLVHRIVLSAFVGQPPTGYVACHQNGVKSDCRIENLRWDTQSGNCADKWIHGTQTTGESSPASKLTENLVREIRSSGMTAWEAVKQHGLSWTNARHIVSGRTWKNVVIPVPETKQPLALVEYA